MRLRRRRVPPPVAAPTIESLITLRDMDVPLLPSLTPQRLHQAVLRTLRNLKQSETSRLKESEPCQLPVADRLRVVESLWDSIDADVPVSLSPEQRAEIDRRVKAHEENADELLTWDEVLDRLRDRK